jgi:hypothetical protein
MACKISKCQQKWQGNEVGYSWNSATCAWSAIWAKWAKMAFHAAQ